MSHLLWVTFNDSQSENAELYDGILFINKQIKILY